MSCLKQIICVVMVSMFFVTFAFGDNWTIVNGGDPLPGGEEFKHWNSIGLSKPLSVTKNGRGDLIYFLNNNIGTVMGRFTSGGQSPSKEWEVYSDGQWSNESDAVTTSITNTIAALGDFTLYPDPDDDTALFGTAASALYNSKIYLNEHGGVCNVVFDETNGWRQWKSEATYDKFYLDRMIRTFDSGNDGRFAYDPNSESGILIGTVGRQISGLNRQLVATKYVHDDSNDKWHRWDNDLENDHADPGWCDNNIWPFTNPFTTNSPTTYILNPEYVSSDTYSQPEIAHLGSGDYLVAFIFETGSSTYVTSARYNEGAEPSWSWWDGSGWDEGENYNYASIGTADPDSKEFVELEDGIASLFYFSDPNLYEIEYDETGGTPTYWSESSLIIDDAEDYCITVDSEKTIWLYYISSGDVYLKKKTLGSSWGSATLIYESASPDDLEVLAADFIDATEVPVCFVTDYLDGKKSYFGLTDPDCQSYWADANSLSLDEISMPVTMDPRISFENQVENNAPGNRYAKSPSGHIAIDNDGYIYSPASANCSIIIRHKDETDTDNSNHWGGFWDFFHIPGGCAVDNVSGRVFVTNDLLTGSGSATVGAAGDLMSFDMSHRGESIGYDNYPNTYIPASWDSEYYHQDIKNNIGWPGDAAVDETQGLLYVTSSSESEILVYDIENLAYYKGDGYKFLKTYFLSGIDEGDDLTNAEQVIEDMVGDPNIPLLEYASDPNYVYWDENADYTITTENNTLEDIVARVKNLDSFSEISNIWPESSSDFNQDKLIRNIRKWYNSKIARPTYSDTIASQGSGSGELMFPQGIDTDPNGNIYVADTCNHRIQKYDSNGQYVSSWGTLGDGDGQFIYPVGVAADPTYNLVYVTDPFNNRLQIFDRDGNFLHSWGSWDGGIEEDFSETIGVAADGEGNIFVGTGKYITKFSIAEVETDENSNGIPDVLDGSLHVIRVIVLRDATVDPSGDYVSASPGGSVTLNFTAGESHYNVYVDGVPQGEVTSYTFSNLSANHTLLIGSQAYNTTSGTYHTTIQDAIFASPFGSTVILEPGIYDGDVMLFATGVTLTSSDPNDWDVVANTIIDGGGSSKTVTCDILPGYDDTDTVTGLTITGGDDYGVYCDSSSPIISNCIVTDNVGGIHAHDGSPVLSGNKIYNNSLIGVYSESDEATMSPTIQNNMIYENFTGIFLFGADNSSEVINNTIADNSWGILDYLTSPTITNCIIWNNSSGDLYSSLTATYSCYSGGSGTNIDDDPNFVDAANDDYHLLPVSPCIDQGDDTPTGGLSTYDIDGDNRAINIVDITNGAGGYVDMGADEFNPPITNTIAETGPYSTIQAAIDAASSGDTIEVGPGTYLEDLTFDNKSITLRSTDPNNANVVKDTTIKGGGTVPAVQFSNGDDSTLSGITVTIVSGSAPGMVVTGSGTDPTISNCVVYSVGSGIVCGNYASPLITSTTVRNNSTGIVFASSSTPTVTNCLVHDNSVQGFIVITTGSTTLMNNTIVGNGKGIFVPPVGSAPTITNCIVWGNTDDLNGCSATYSCIKIVADASGTGNITGDPNDPDFVDSANDDYHLTQDSPCIDVGTNSGAPSTDIDGESRPHDGDVDGTATVDMGADENDISTSWFYGAQCYGDADDDDDVDFADFLVLDAAYGKNYVEDWNAGAGPYDPAADFDRNGEVDLTDFTILQSYYDTSPDPNCVGGGVWPPVQ